MGVLKFCGVSKKYPYEKEFLLTDLSFEVGEGERVGIAAEKQCGKTSVVKMIAGLTMPTDGKILLYGKPLEQTPPSDRGIGAVFDDFALMKGKTVRKNLEFPLKVRKAEDFRQKATAAAENFGLEDLLDVKAKKLSAEQKFLTALARLSAREINLLVLDDVLRNIDKNFAIQYIGRFLEGRNCGVLQLSSSVDDLAYCGRVYVVADGAVVFCGGYDEAKSFVETSRCFDKFGINDDMQKLSQR